MPLWHRKRIVYLEEEILHLVQFKFFHLNAKVGKVVTDGGRHAPPDESVLSNLSQTFEKPKNLRIVEQLSELSDLVPAVDPGRVILPCTKIVLLCYCHTGRY